ncbi:MAG: helix-turn-helix domain-containing protein [Burkholderiales bacterium]|nr:helix-turn-helix domain-containing protein [Burkholderiales bacterium]
MPAHAISPLRSVPAENSAGLRLVPAMAEAEPLLGMPGEVAAVVTKLASGKRRVRMGEFLYRSGTPFHSLYVVRAGMFKTILLDSEGREQVTGFQMTGEVLGMDGIEKEICQSNALALEDSEVWEVPFTRLETLCRQDPGMQRVFHRLMSREIQRDYLMMLLLGSMSAEERLAAFLVNLSQRLTARGYSATRFILRMSRREIGSFLGLTLETVSRVFSRFQREGLIRAELKAVELKDVARLRAMVGISVLNAA